MMNRVLSILVACGITCGAAMADDSNKKLTDAEKARIKEQVESLQKSKLDDASNTAKDLKKDAVTKGKAIDERVKNQNKQVDDLATNNKWLYGHDLMKNAADGRKAQIQAEAQAEKDKIANDAKRRAAEKQAAAQKAAASVQQTVDGLKSQVGKDGQFGLQPKGSNLNVRNYGK